MTNQQVCAGQPRQPHGSALTRQYTWSEHPMGGSQYSVQHGRLWKQRWGRVCFQRQMKQISRNFGTVYSAAPWNIGFLCQCGKFTKLSY